mgnify:CR=1 FL=1
MGEIINAKIKSTSLEIEDHGIYTFWITVEFYGGGVSIGGYCIGKCTTEGIRAWTGGSEAIMHILDTVGVSKWEELPGQYIRIEKGLWGSGTTKIGNIIKDKWFDLDKFFKKKQKEAETNAGTTRTD